MKNIHPNTLEVLSSSSNRCPLKAMVIIHPLSKLDWQLVLPLVGLNIESLPVQVDLDEHLHPVVVHVDHHHLLEEAVVLKLVH